MLCIYNYLQLIIDNIMTSLYFKHQSELTQGLFNWR